MDRIRTQTRHGAPISVDSITIKPVAQSVSWIGRHFGFVWNRPYAVRVEQGGQSYQIPIRDYTQIGMAVLWGLTAAFIVMAVRKSKKQWRRSND